MARRPHDWFEQAQFDLDAAKNAFGHERYEWAAFAAHQAAENTLKAAWQSQGVEARGHSLDQLIEALSDTPPAARGAAKRLDKHYVGARYPIAHPGGSPGRLYTELEARQALENAAEILSYAEGQLPQA
jgi:HEPN domain-containing protein